MGFFDDYLSAEDTPERPHPPERLYARTEPSWRHTPDEYFLPAVLPWPRELGRSEDTVLALREILVWPESCTFELVIFGRRTLLDRSRQSLPGLAPSVPDRADPRRLRFGVLLADGRRATSRDQWPPLPAPDPPAGPALRQGGSSGGQFRLDLVIDLWPLPPDGPLTLVVEWPERDVPETWTELDGAAVRAATAGVVEIWSDLPPAPAGTTASSGIRTHSSTVSTSSTSTGFAVARRVEPEPDQK